MTNTLAYYGKAIITAVGIFMKKAPQVRILLVSAATVIINGTARMKKNVNNCLKTNIYSYLETSGGQSYILYINAVHFFNTSFN